MESKLGYWLLTRIYNKADPVEIHHNTRVFNNNQLPGGVSADELVAGVMEELNLGVSS